MSWVTVTWSMAAGTCLTLGLVHFLVWCWDRSLRASLWFAGVALSVAVMAGIECAIMRVRTSAEFYALHRWGHLTFFFTIAFVVGFVQSYFRSGRPWLAWSLIAVRALVVGLAFVPGPTFNFREVTAMVPFEFLGETLMAPKGMLTPWEPLGESSGLLLLMFVMDAAVRLWRKGDARARQRALVVGGGVVLFTVSCMTNGILVHNGAVHVPYFIALSFMLIVAAMGFELSRDMMDATRMAQEVRENAESMSLAAAAAQLAHWRWDIPRDAIWTSTPGRGLYGIAEAEPITFERFLATLHPDDRENARRAVNESMDGSGDFHISYRVLSAGGATRWIEARGKVEFVDRRPLRMLGVSVDVTRQRRMQDRFRLAVEASPSGVMLTNAEGRILLVNGHAERMFGYESAKMIGESIESLLPERMRELHATLRAGFHAAPTARAMGLGRELFARRKDGREFPVEIGINPVESEEGTLVLSVIVDITERRKAEAEARELRDELAHVTRVTTLSELSGSLAHELNQPLAIILSNAQAAQRLLAQSPPDVAEVSDILADIIGEDRRAGEVIRRLRALLKRGETTLVPLSLNEAIEDVLHLAQADLIGRGVVVVRELAEGLPEVSGDRVQLQQVMLNLILNGADAMSANAPGARCLHIITAHYDSAVRVSVRDEGCGLPADAEKVFQPFFTTKPHGLGMGLAICRAIIGAHGGNLWTEANRERGTVFHFDLPEYKVESI